MFCQYFISVYECFVCTCFQRCILAGKNVVLCNIFFMLGHRIFSGVGLLHGVAGGLGQNGGCLCGQLSEGASGQGHWGRFQLSKGF